MCDSSKSWCALGCPSFLSSPSGVVAGVGISLATHLLFFFVIVIVFYILMWDSSKSWYALGCPSFLLSLSGVVAGVGVPLATHLLSFYCCCCCCFLPPPSVNRLLMTKEQLRHYFLNKRGLGQQCCLGNNFLHMTSFAYTLPLRNY